jgi:hypothetical protein
MKRTTSHVSLPESRGRPTVSNLRFDWLPSDLQVGHPADSILQGTNLDFNQDVRKSRKGLASAQDLTILRSLDRGVEQSGSSSGS